MTKFQQAINTINKLGSTTIMELNKLVDVTTSTLREQLNLISRGGFIFLYGNEIVKYKHIEDLPMAKMGDHPHNAKAYMITKLVDIDDKRFRTLTIHEQILALYLKGITKYTIREFREMTGRKSSSISASFTTLVRFRKLEKCGDVYECNTMPPVWLPFREFMSDSTESDRISIKEEPIENTEWIDAYCKSFERLDDYEAQLLNKTLHQAWSWG